MVNKRRISSHLQRLSVVKWFLESVRHHSSIAFLVSEIIIAPSSPVQATPYAAVLGTNLANSKLINIDAVMTITSSEKYLYHPTLIYTSPLNILHTCRCHCFFIFHCCLKCNGQYYAFPYLMEIRIYERNGRHKYNPQKLLIILNTIIHTAFARIVARKS